MQESIRPGSNPNVRLDVVINVRSEDREIAANQPVAIENRQI